MDAIKKLDRSVKGRAVLVTGAASGMGRATAHVFASEGALVAVTDINEAGVARVVEEIKADGGRAEGWRLDVLDAAQIKRVVAEVAKSFGRLDILINNAGFGGVRTRRSYSGRERLRRSLGPLDRRLAHRTAADGSRRAATSEEVGRGPNREHRLD
jgi:NAD(P)-dependent dehydrogenase (short-subunit alcohol dehydrogenase family)